MIFRYKEAFSTRIHKNIASKICLDFADKLLIYHKTSLNYAKSVKHLIEALAKSELKSVAQVKSFNDAKIYPNQVWHSNFEQEEEEQRSVFDYLGSRLSLRLESNRNDNGRNFKAVQASK
jgi:hypothetical protein